MMIIGMKSHILLKIIFISIKSVGILISKNEIFDKDKVDDLLLELDNWLILIYESMIDQIL